MRLTDADAQDATQNPLEKRPWTCRPWPPPTRSGLVNH